MTWANHRTPEQARKAFKSAENRRDKIKSFLTERKMTKKDFAAAAGISPTTFSRFMSGRMQTGSIAFGASARYMKMRNAEGSSSKTG